MADTPKVLGQLAAAETTLETLIAAGAVSVVSTITVCNRSSTPTTFRILVRVAAAGESDGQYIFYDMPIEGNDTIALTMGITLAAADVLSFYAGAATLSVNAFGIQIS